MDMLESRIRGAKTDRGSELESEVGMGISMRKSRSKPSTAKESIARLNTGPKKKKKHLWMGLKQPHDYSIGGRENTRNRHRRRDR